MFFLLNLANATRSITAEKHLYIFIFLYQLLNLNFHMIIYYEYIITYFNKIANNIFDAVCLIKYFSSSILSGDSTLAS